VDVRLRVLLVEDSPVDAVMIERALGRAGHEIVLTRVDTAEGLTAALGREPWDLVLSDYSMPGWSGLDALGIARELAPDLPFILVSGTIGEEVAVEAMRSGASDYLLKDRLTRLPAAVERAVEAAEVRREYGRSRVALAFLAQATAALSRSLEPEAVAETLVALAVPLLADGAVVHLVEAEGALRRVAVHDLVGSDVPEARAVTLPLAMRDTMLGCLTLVSSGGPRPMIDEGLATELAARAAVALQNALLYRQAEAAIAVRSEFIQIAAHELRTPLTPLSLQVESLLRSSRDAGADTPVARFEPDIQATGRYVQRLTTLVDRLLDVSNLGLGLPRLDRETVDLAGVATDVATAFAPQAREAGTTVEVRVQGPVVGAWDRVRMRQVLGHLLSNAIKFGAGKPVVVTIESDGARVHIAVRDHGPGIGPADQARIFERFERAVSLRRHGGFGVGLWMAREIVRAHGGILTVASRIGEGATFTMDLPIVSGTATTEARQNW
jgi:signal transduction histidine kinase